MKGGLFQKAQAQTARRTTSREPRAGSAPPEARAPQQAQESNDGGQMDETTRSGGTHPRDKAAQEVAGAKKLQRVAGTEESAEDSAPANSGPSSASTSAPLGGHPPPEGDDDY